MAVVLSVLIHHFNLHHHHHQQPSTSISQPKQTNSQPTKTIYIYKTFTMQFTIAAFVAILAHTALALPAQVEDRQIPYTPCSGLYGTSQCCATDVLGLADLDCAGRMLNPYPHKPLTAIATNMTPNSPNRPNRRYQLQRRLLCHRPACPLLCPPYCKSLPAPVPLSTFVSDH